MFYRRNLEDEIRGLAALRSERDALRKFLESLEHIDHVREYGRRCYRCEADRLLKEQAMTETSKISRISGPDKIEDYRTREEWTRKLEDAVLRLVDSQMDPTDFVVIAGLIERDPDEAIDKLSGWSMLSSENLHADQAIYDAIQERRAKEQASRSSQEE